MFTLAMVFNLLAAMVFLIAFFFIIKEKVREAFAIVVVAMSLASAAGFCRSYGLDDQGKELVKCEEAARSK